MRGDARSRKQNGKPELPIQGIPQRGESRSLIWMVVHRDCHGPTLELLENQTGRYPVADLGSAAGRFRQRLRECANMQMRSFESIHTAGTLTRL